MGLCVYLVFLLPKSDPSWMGIRQADSSVSPLHVTQALIGVQTSLPGCPVGVSNHFWISMCLWLLWLPAGSHKVRGRGSGWARCRRTLRL